MAIDAAGEVTREIRIEAHPEIVFEFITDPALMVRWMGTEAELDPRPGGIYRVVVNPRSTVRGEYVEVVPHTRIVFTWGFEDAGATVAPGGSTVEITLAPDGDGTVLRLVHRDLPTPSRPQHEKGWEHFLDRLLVTAAGDDPGPDPWAA